MFGIMMFGNCASCGNECVVIVEKDGIGAHEFWGTPGHDLGVVISSDCCAAEVVNDRGRQITEDEVHDG